jgi:branched-chain amino acid transport system substrate-binding protein
VILKMRPNGGDSSEGGRLRTRRHRIGVALALASAVFVAACSNSGSASDSNSSGTASAAAGSTINIGEIADLTGATTFPSGTDGAKAAVAAVNKAGGINGHKLNLIVCDSQANPNVAVECANQMVSSHVLYVDTDFSNEGDSFMPVLRSAGIPVMTGTPVGTDELSFPNSYVLGSGTTIDGGAAAMCAKLGATKIGIAQLDVAGLAPLVNLTYKTIAPFGLTQANTSITLIPPTAVDLSVYAAALIQKSNCIVQILGPNQEVSLAAAVHSQDPSIPIVAPANTSVAQWQTIGKLADNVCENASSPPATLTGAPGIVQYNAEMDAYNKSGTRDGISIAGWASVHLAAKVLAKVANPTAATYMQALNAAGTISVPPLPPLNFTKPVNLIPGVTRLMSADVVYYRHVSGGSLAPLYGGQFVDVMSLKSQPAVSTAPRC